MGDNGPHDTEIYADFACAHARQTAAIADFPGGQVLLIVRGIITAGIGGYFIYKGARQKFREDITRPSGRSQSAITVLAMTGYMAKDIAILALGVLFVVAAVKVDPKLPPDSMEP